MTSRGHAIRSIQTLKEINYEILYFETTISNRWNDRRWRASVPVSGL